MALSLIFAKDKEDRMSAPIAPKNMPRIGTVNERFQSYNVEMIEVIGGRFWKPYDNQTSATPEVESSLSSSNSDPVGMALLCLSISYNERTPGQMQFGTYL